MDYKDLSDGSDTMESQSLENIKEEENVNKNYKSEHRFVDVWQRTSDYGVWQYIRNEAREGDKVL